MSPNRNMMHCKPVEESLTMKPHSACHVNLRLVLVSSVTCFLLTTTLISWSGFCGQTDIEDYSATFIKQETPIGRDDDISMHYNGSLPFNVWVALKESKLNGYLVGNSSNLTFHPYAEEVDLRLVVLAFNRALSLHECLRKLNKVDFEGDHVVVDIWLDRSLANNSVDAATYHVAKQFNFTNGAAIAIHIQPYHAGVLGQWVNSWRPRVGTREIAVVLEDDTDVSPYFWRWLKRAHVAFANRYDVSGFGLSHPGLAHQYGGSIQLHPQKTIYMYRVITTWGFSPEPTRWRDFQNWFFEVDQNISFAPLVPGILPSEWWLGEKKIGRERDLWEMWHIYYTHQHNQYTVLLNSLSEGLMAVNRHERGLHDGKYATGAKDEVCSNWHERYVIFPKDPPKIGYDGVEESLEEY